MSELPITSISEINPGARLPSGLAPSDLVSFIPMGDVSESGEWTVRQTREFRSISAGFTAFEPGDVLFAKITPCMENGKGAHAISLKNGIGFGSTEFHVLRAKPGNSPRFVFHLSQWRKLRQAAESKMVGSAGQKRVPRSFFESYLVTKFDGQDQSLIADIIDALDAAIRETEAIISKLKAVKQGLLHDLLTRGIDANGELRPPQSEAPHLYKPSSLGSIPKAWDEITIGEITRRTEGLLQTGPFGSQLHAHEYTIEGIPVVMPQDMLGDELSLDNIARVTEQKANTLMRHRLRPNDLVFSRRGDLSRCVAIDEHSTGWLCGTGCLLARLAKTLVNAYWLAIVYRQPMTQSQVMGRAVGSTMPNLNTAILAAISIGLPSVGEQDEIVKRVASLSLQIRSEELALLKQRLQKSALMDDLLTGRVRVTPLLETADA